MGLQEPVEHVLFRLFHVVVGFINEGGGVLHGPVHRHNICRIAVFGVDYLVPEAVVIDERRRTIR